MDVGLAIAGMISVALWISWRGLHSLRNLLRLPVPLLWVVVAVLCWEAFT